MSFSWFSYPVFPGVPSAWQPWVFWGLVLLSLVLLGLVIRLLVRKTRRVSEPQPVESVLPTEKQTAKQEQEEKQQEEPVVLVPQKREEALRTGLRKTRSGFVARLGQLFGKKQIDADMLEQLEAVLFGADVGTKTAQVLFERIRTRLSQQELNQEEALWATLREEAKQLVQVASPPLELGMHKPFVVLILGVNGVGKTTTIGKLAAQWKGQGKQVVLAAGDTFRAAAAEQLSIWGQRVGAPVVQGKEGADPSSVIFEGIKQAQHQGADVVIADTAGRLHVKAQLMEELQKVRRVIQKADPTAPHETWLVLDATTGQNAIAQASTFKEMLHITGIVLTKLDGTAKGGVVLGICHELQIPVRYIGVGEGVDDLRPFDANAFVEALFMPPGAEDAAS